MKLFAALKKVFCLKRNYDCPNMLCLKRNVTQYSQLVKKLYEKFIILKCIAQCYYFLYYRCIFL